MKKFLKEHDWLERAAKTFIQAFVGAFVASLSFGFASVDEAKTYYLALAGSAAAAGISAVWNVLKEHFESEETE
ncbi:MAG: holin [Bacilli bacterium]|nr:holin [Bacilli bacterium]